MVGQKQSNGAIPLSDEQKINWLRLIRSDNVGPATFRDLINHFHSAAAALDALPDLISKGGSAGKIKIASRQQAEREIEFAEQNQARFIGMGEPDYPPALRSVDYPPPLICVKGSSAVLNRPSIGIVGSRNASINGMRLAARFASELGQADYVVISGLARGIDASAHQHSLSTGTIAVFAGGVDHIFPDENRALAQDILDHEGAIISEMPMGWQPRAKDFPRRNRLVAGISSGLLVIEAAKRSGSLISARLANEAGRTVYAIPGSPLDPRCEGNNWLLKQGATLVTEPKDIVEDQAHLRVPTQEGFWGEDDERNAYDQEVERNTQFVEDDADMRKAILNALGPSPVEVDDIIRFSGASAGQVQLVLIELSLAGRLERHGGNRVSLT
ncbi:MAG: DNA-processing protein DprA [Salaquimonas sp.]